MTKKNFLDSHGPNYQAEARQTFDSFAFSMDVFYEGNNYLHKIASEFQDSFSQL